MKRNDSRGPETSVATFPWKALGLFVSLQVLVLVILFGRAAHPNYVVFSNDGPLGGMVAEQNRVPEILTGLWADLNWIGGPYLAPAPNVSTLLRLITSPLFFSKLYAPFSLIFLGLCAWFCFWRFFPGSPAVWCLGGLAATLNSDFVGTACWGVCMQPIAFGTAFLALAALADTTSPRAWLQVVVAGFFVGLGILEAYDIGALFSLFIGVFVLVQALAGPERLPQRLTKGLGRLAVVVAVAALTAYMALTQLVGTQIKGVVGMEQDAETKAARWSQATQYSITKAETLGMLVPGLFGFRSDTPGGGAYWGRAGSDPSWDEFIKSGGKAGQPGGAFRAGAGSIYGGVLVWLLAIFGVAQSFRKQGGPFSRTERRLVWFWLVVVVVAVLLMFGRFAPFYQIFYALPYVSTIRNPAKFVHIAEWALVILFAYGVAAMARVGFVNAARVAGGVGAHWKTFWAKVGGFDRKWVVGSAVAVVVLGLGWLVFASARGTLEQHLMEWTRLQYLAQGASPESAAAGAAATADAARATARASVGQVARTALFLIPAVALVAITISGYFRGPRWKLGAGLLVALLLVDMTPVNRPWVVMVNWKEKYASNAVIDFLRERPYEQRIAIFAAERFVDLNRLPRELQPMIQQYSLFASLYRIEWTQHLFHYNNIQTLDIIQEPRLATDKAAYESALAFTPVRRWELTNTRYLLGPTAFQDFLNQQLDAGRNRFRIATAFNLAAKPGAAGQRLEEITTTISTNGQLAVFEFTGALPRASLYTDWMVSTNDPAALQEWVAGIKPRLPRDMGTALAAQDATDLATLHKLADPDFDPAQTVLLAEPIDLAPSTNATPGTVRFVNYAPKRIVLAVNSPAPAVLLLNDKHDPNWQVTIDGQPATLLRANYIMRAVAVPAGEHQVEFRFAPSTSPLYVSLAAIAIALALIGYLTVTGIRREVSKADSQHTRDHP